MVLGARPGDMERMVIADGMRLGQLGIGAGLLGAYSLARYMAPLIYGVGTHDPLTFSLAPIVLPMVAVAASWVPARRASRVDLGGLREE
jgi:putative ABC transport system permease protein